MNKKQLRKTREKLGTCGRCDRPAMLSPKRLSLFQGKVCRTCWSEIGDQIGNFAKGLAAVIARH